MFKKRSSKKKELNLDQINSDPDSPPQKASPPNHSSSLLSKRDLPTPTNPHSADFSRPTKLQKFDSSHLPPTPPPQDDDPSHFKAGYSTSHEHQRLKNLVAPIEDPRDILKRQVEISNNIKSGLLDPNIYRGKNGYAIYKSKTEDEISKSKFTGSIGPIKQSTHFKFSSNVDYNPSLCKDYNQTGYCVFGDSCIFVHDRGDYKAGWELEIDWNKKQAAKQRKNQERFEKQQRGEELNSDDLEGSEVDGIEEYSEEGNYDNIGEKCLICGGDYRSPVVTRCEHIFCEGCA